MDERDRRAIVWREIESKAFHPLGTAKIEKWLQIYKRSLSKLWEVEPLPEGNPNAPFNLPVLPLQCFFSNDDGRGLKFTITISSSKNIFWHLEVDPAYYSKANGLSQSKNYPSEHIKQDLEGDIETVLDGMLFHPRCHMHGNKLNIRPLVAPALDSREIRLGGGTENLFIFLAHVRYQFCIVSQGERDREKSRLVKLFTDAITNKNKNIPPAQLFPFRGLITSSKFNP
jgi:hypothetical protein